MRAVKLLMIKNGPWSNLVIICIFKSGYTQAWTTSVRLNVSMSHDNVALEKIKSKAYTKWRFMEVSFEKYRVFTLWRSLHSWFKKLRMNIRHLFPEKFLIMYARLTGGPTFQSWQGRKHLSKKPNSKLPQTIVWEFCIKTTSLVVFCGLHLSVYFEIVHTRR